MTRLMSIEHAILEISGQYLIEPSLLVETAQEEPSLKNAILKYAKGEIHGDDFNYIMNQVF